MKNRLISVLVLSLLAACASDKPKETVAESKPAPVTEAPKVAVPASEPTAAAPAYSPPPAAPMVAMDPLNDPNSLLAKRSVYFPFDVSVVQDADKPAVEAHAQYLSEHANRKVRVEGNCDERGSDEYNLALGQRRADGVKKMLLVGGAKDGQIETVSFGEEKPKATGHDETAWSQNRRADLNYSAK